MKKIDSIGNKKEKINDLISYSNYVVFYDTKSIMNTRELIKRIFDQRNRLIELGFSEKEIFKIIYESGYLRDCLLEDEIFDLLVDYYINNVP